MNDYLHDALNEICDRHLAEAMHRKKKRRIPWIPGVAASLAAVLLLVLLNPAVPPAVSPTIDFRDPTTGYPEPPATGYPEPPATGYPEPPATGYPEPPATGFPNSPTSGMYTTLAASPTYPAMAPYPQNPNTSNDTPEYDNWKAGLKSQYDQPLGYAYSLESFFLRSIPLFLDSGTENAVCSPVNIYMALAMLAETTGGESREAVLNALNTWNIESLRAQAGHVWNAHYRSDGAAACLLANSLWLNEGFTYNPNTVNTLAESYYAAVYQGAFGAKETDDALRGWLSQQTQGLLDRYIQGVELSPQDALALASTVYFRGRWDSEFRKESNTQGLFHSPKGDVEATFMNKTMSHGPYYYGPDFGAVKLQLDAAGVYGESAMWLILPDEGYTPGDILDSGHAMEMILSQRDPNRNHANIIVHLSLPKFDVSAETDLKEPLTALGLGDLFSESAADFSAILPEAVGAHLGKTTHAARVAIDEEGVTAAAYTVLVTAGAMAPPEEEVYFTLDRPFVFVLTSHDGLPLFAGVVNTP